MARKTWSIVETSVLMEEYKKERNLWDPKNKEYKNRMSKQVSLNRLAGVFGVSDTEVERKVKNLLSQHRRERRKHRQHKKSGEAVQFQSKWFGYHLMGFLNEKYKQRRAQEKEDLQLTDSSLSSDENEYDYTQEYFNESQDQWENKIQIKEEKIEDYEDAYQDVQNIQNVQDVQESKEQRKQIKPENASPLQMVDIMKSIDEQKKLNNVVDESTIGVANIMKSIDDKKRKANRDVGETTAGMVNIMKKFCDQRRPGKDGDELDIFGELISVKIRNLKTHYARATVQNLINNILYQAEIGNYDAPSPSPSMTHQNNILNRCVAIREYTDCPSTSTYSSVDITYPSTQGVSVQRTECLENNLN